MEKFIKIAESINNLSVFNAYEIARLDIQLVASGEQFHYQFHAFLTLQGREGESTFDFHIYPDGHFEEVE